MATRSPVLSFLGAARTVTGSRFLLDHPDGRVLVDCGMFQGLRRLRERNREPFGVPPESIDAVVLTHAHVDHLGYLPALVRDGFHGPIVCTPGTADLAAIVLPDAGRLQEEEAAFANRMGYSKHHPALPLYTEDDARAALGQLAPVPFDERRGLPGLQVTLRRAGHILGSASALLEHDDGPVVLVSGDLGRSSHPLLQPPAPLTGLEVDWVLVESTYGDRRHDDHDAIARLGDAVRSTAAHGGTVVIPAFAVDRTEVVLFHLRRLMDAGTIPRLPVYVDSPMALDALRAYRRALADPGSDMRDGLDADGDPFDTGTMEEVRDPEGSKRIDRLHVPSIIVSASGMATGGRVLHHLARFLPESRNTVVLVGFQAAGTRGRALADGARQLKLLGQYVPVRARIVDLPALSVHADASEIVTWLATLDHEPDGVFVVHGEELAAKALRDRVIDRFGWPAIVPHHGERVRLDPIRRRRSRREAL
jgi:metallo-beta-lactamase family protein